MSRRDAKIDDARHVLRICGAARGGDFHVLSSSQQQSLADQAAIRRYKKPTNAPGSTSRSFHDFMQRVASWRKENEDGSG